MEKLSFARKSLENPCMKALVGAFGATLLLFVALAVFKSYVDRKAAEKVDAILAKLPVLAQYETVSGDPFTNTVEVKGLVLKAKGWAKPTSIERVVLSDVEVEEGFPRRADIVVEGFCVPLEVLDGDTRAFLQAVGYRKVPCLDLKVLYESDGDVFSLKEVALKAHEAFDLTAALELRGLTAARMAFRKLSAVEDPFAALAALGELGLAFENAELRRVILEYRDRGFADRVLNGLAREMKTDRSQIVKMAVEQVRANFPGNDRLSRMVREALISFLKRPERLRVEVSPKKPVTLRKIFEWGSDPEFLYQTLGLRVET